MGQWGRAVEGESGGGLQKCVSKHWLLLRAGGRGWCDCSGSTAGFLAGLK